LGRTHGKADRGWKRSEDRRVAGPSGNHDVDIRCQRTLEGAHSHLANNMGRRVDISVSVGMSSSFCRTTDLRTALSMSARSTAISRFLHHI
jgi:hypothetical protein